MSFFRIQPSDAMTELYGVGTKADAQVFDNTAMLRQMQFAQQAGARKDIAEERQRQAYADKVDKQIAGLGDKVFERDEASFQQQATDMYNWSVENSNKLREGNPTILAEWNNKVSQFHREAAISNQIGKEYYKEKAISDNEMRRGTSFYDDTNKPWEEFGSDAHIRDYNLPKGREKVTSLFDWHTKTILPQKTKWMADTQKGESEITPDEARLMIDNSWNEVAAQIARRELGNPEIATPEYLQKIGYTAEESKHPDEINPKDYAEKKLLDVTTGKRTPRPMVGRGGFGGGASTKQATVTRRDNSTEMFTPLSKVEVISVGGKQFNINAVHSTFDKDGKITGGYAVDADVAAENNKNQRQRVVENNKLNIELQKLKEEFAPLIADPSYSKEGKQTLLKELETLTTGIKNRRDMINVSYPTDLDEKVILEQQVVIELQSGRLKGAHPEAVVSGEAKGVAITENDERTKKGKGAVAVKAKAYSAEQEAEIRKNMKANPLYSREEIIKALNY